MELRHWRWAVIVTWFVAACTRSGPSTPPIQATRPAPPAPAVTLESGVDGSQRLGRNVVPVDYDLWLDIDPSRDRFWGRTRINVHVEEPTTRFALHASELAISKVELRDQKNTHLKARLLPGPNAGLTLVAERALQGDWQLEFEYEAPLDEVPESIYRVKQGDDWYVYSQLEALMARQAFPCFDEPGFKTPFRVQLRVPHALTALANAPLHNVRADGATHQVFEFAPTAPIPTYLVAFAVGKFAQHRADVTSDASGSKAGEPLPHNVYTVAGKEHLATYAGAQATPILRALTSYFGSPYPYAKLDQIGVPTFAFGAMENVGLVTYRENILLLDESRASHRDRAVVRSVMAHELAHMWFGNLVTPAWWDDIWLNEAFATWMANKVLEQIAPELEAPLWAVADMLHVMQEDALGSASPIRKVIETTGDIQNAFDGITYQKGFAVLRMLETWIGKERFQRGVRSYLEQHAWGNATMADFMQSLSEQSPLPVEHVAKTFIEQPGTPLVRVHGDCTPNREGARLTLRLSQQRYVPLGVEKNPSQNKGSIWTLPVCLRFLDAKNANNHRALDNSACTVFEGSEQTWELTRSRCPAAFHPNADEVGYYHYALADAELLALVSKHFSHLSLAERVALPHHALALLQSGDIALSTYVQVLKAAATDPHRLVLEGVIAGLAQLNTFAPSSELSQLADRLLTSHSNRIGLQPKAVEPSNDALLRPTLLAALGRFSASAQLKQAATRTFSQFAATPSQVPLERLQTLLPLAARFGDASTHTTLTAQLPSALPGVREAIIEALGSFTQPELLRKTYDLLLSGEIRLTERWSLIRAAANSRASYAVYFEWYRNHEKDLLTRLGSAKSDLPWDASFHCSKQERDMVAAHFHTIERYGSGAAKNLTQTLETIDRCTALRERFGAQTRLLSN